LTTSTPSEANELADVDVLARYVLYSRYIRKDGTIRQQAFMPDPYTELSVTCRLGLLDQKVWAIGEAVATGQKKTLHACADVTVATVKIADLDVIADPAPGNPNHANIIKWPSDKHLRKKKAEALAARSTKRSTPEAQP